MAYEFKEKIIIVDDSTLSRKTIRDILEEHQLNVIGEASKADQITDLIKSQGANLFIVDVVMPELSGIELVKEINDNFFGIYCIMISSLKVEHIIMDSIAAGAMDYITKPFSPEQILQAVRKGIKYLKENA